MTILAPTYRLVPRGGAGLACDDDGVALGPMALVESTIDASGRRFYRVGPAHEVTQALHLAYGCAPEEIERRRRGLARVAKLLTTGKRAQAGIEAVQLAFPEIAPAAMAKLARAASLQKYNPNFAEQTRNPAGGPGGGQWTSGGAEDGGRGEDQNIRPAAAPMNPIQAMKERFVDAHLADAQKGAKELGIPVENILGLSALESTWGTSRFAVHGNNYFGIHYPAPYANGFMQAQRSKAKVATFANYSDSLKSFIALSGALVRGKSDPEAFATALQNSGKFGIDTDTGAKIPTYVSGVAATIRGLRPLVPPRSL